MANTTVIVPDFDWSAFYYAQIYEALLKYKRINVPELTDESEFEPFNQLLRASALVGHLNNVLSDLIANESTIVTAQLVDTVRNMLRNIDYKMSPATPAGVDIVYKLAKVFNSSYLLVPQGSQAATARQGNEPAIVYETNSNLTVSRTDKFTYLFLKVAFLTGGEAWTDVSANPALLVLPPQMGIGCAVYFGHDSVMWNKMSWPDVPGGTLLGAGYTAIWEYYDGDFSKIQPDTVIQIGSTLRFDLNNLLGTLVRVGSTIRVTLNENGIFEDTVSLWDGSKNYVLVGLLGQSSPSFDIEDYSVGSDWVEIESTDDTNMLQAGTNRNISWNLPQSDTENWIKTTIVGTDISLNTFSGTGYFIRFRVVNRTSSPQNPYFINPSITAGKQFVLAQATQGQLVADDPLGSSSGTPDQSFLTSHDFFIVGTMSVTVDAEQWTEVDNFFDSTPVDKHYVVDLGTNDRATITFGSGLQGKIPSIGANNISCEYRFGADSDGNVGPLSITVDKTGLTFIDSITNPRQASGWQEAEGSTSQSLARAKIAGPASIRTREVAIGPDDVTWLVLNKYTTASGSKPYARALAIEEGLGPKTIELILVKKGSTIASSSDLQDVNDWFNGNVGLNYQKRIVANQQLTSFNYSQRIIDIQAIVTVSGDVTTEEIVNNLRQTVQPLAQRDDGTYEWTYGSTVPRSRLIHEIFNTNQSKILNVVLNQPSGDITIGRRELPLAGSVSITIIQQ